jgi:CRISPR-associated protein Cmr4
MTTTKLTFIHALSPLHAGTGQGIGVIDLPIAREKATNIPYLPGSSLKGALRDLCEDNDAKIKVFGPETNNADAHAGSAVFSDQRLLLLPVRSLRGTFAWATSPYMLQRFKRDAADAGVNVSALKELPSFTETECLVASHGSELTQQGGQAANTANVYLEDFDLTGKPSDAADAWAQFIGAKVFEDAKWQAALKARMCILSDNVFNFLLEHGTEITARVKLLDDKKTVQSGALWYEEALPAETILSGLLVAVKGKASADEVFSTVGGILKQHKAIQFGGKATVGRGLCSIRLSDGKGAAQ